MKLPRMFGAPLQQLRNERGITMIELFVALSLSAIVVSLAFYSWNSISAHISNQRALALFQDEFFHYSRSVATQLRCSAGITDWSSSHIRFLPAHGDCTLVFQCNERGFTRSDTPVIFPLSKGNVIKLDIQDIYHTPFAPWLTLSITLTAQSPQNHLSTVTRVVTAKRQILHPTEE